MVQHHDGTVEIVPQHPGHGARAGRGDRAAQSGGDVYALMGAPVPHGGVVGQHLLAVAPGQLAGDRPGVDRLRGGRRGGFLRRLLPQDLGALLLQFVLRRGQHRLRFRHGGQGLGALGRQDYRLHPFVVQTQLVLLANVFSHSPLPGYHHPGGNANDGSAQEEDYVEALPREKSLQLTAGAVAVHCT